MDVVQLRCYEHICKKKPLVSKTTKCFERTHSPFSKHKETTLGARKKHENMIKRLVTKLGEVLDLFSSGPAKNTKSGALLDNLILKGLLKSDEISERHLQDFILKRIKVSENDAVSFFAPIKNPKLKTGFELKVWEAKVINQLKEDKQTFGLLITKVMLILSSISSGLEFGQ